ncbi:MAG: hypothetical protein KDB14_33910 [Planctomycetales bacterium]|nr:hypothetical protein [Planctomycetales bacterium]
MGTPRHRIARVARLAPAIWLGCALATVAIAQAPPLPEPISPGSPVSPDSPNADYDVLLHGVIHEAFVEPAAEVSEPTILTEQPPEPIREQPPEEQPEGHNVVWIPGYWAWDFVEQPTETSSGAMGFVWVSGLWRDVPPGRNWISGYWQEVEGGFQWSPGYWLDRNLVPQTPETAGVEVAPQVVYLPAPPDSLDQGPNIISPGADCFWVPGHWEYHIDHYVWHAGFWARQHTGWVWTPARYVCTPYGHVYLSGYWDYEPAARGQLFSVVVFNRPVYRYDTYTYCPRHAVNHSSLSVNLFIGSKGHFYYGNHYSHHHRRHGFVPWYECSGSWHRTSPLISYSRWQDTSRGVDFQRHMDELKLRVELTRTHSLRTLADAHQHGGQRVGQPSGPRPRSLHVHDHDDHGDVSQTVIAVKDAKHLHKRNADELTKSTRPYGTRSARNRTLADGAVAIGNSGPQLHSATVHDSQHGTKPSEAMRTRPGARPTGAKPRPEPNIIALEPNAQKNPFASGRARVGSVQAATNAPQPLSTDKPDKRPALTHQPDMRSRSHEHSPEPGSTINSPRTRTRVVTSEPSKNVTLNPATTAGANPVANPFANPVATSQPTIAKPTTTRSSRAKQLFPPAVKPATPAAPIAKPTPRISTQPRATSIVKPQPNPQPQPQPQARAMPVAKPLVKPTAQPNPQPQPSPRSSRPSRRSLYRSSKDKKER